MLKEDRYQVIMNSLKENNVIEVSSLAKSLNVTEMTIRRDFKDLEDKKLLVRVHGGAKRVDASYTELSDIQKRNINVNKKIHIAQLCAKLINNNDTIFIGSGTTANLIFDYLNVENLKIITNSINVFNRVKNLPNSELILTGGRFRQKTGTFVGYFANKLLSEIKVKKAFIGTNGISGAHITTANEEEGHGNRIILDNASERYILADSTKFGTEAFFSFYNTPNITAIITDNGITPQNEDDYSKMTTILR